MAVLTDHPYASLTLPDDAAADCLFLRPGLPGTTPFLLHRGGGDLPNSQEVREEQTPPTRERSLSFPVEECREPFCRSLGGVSRTDQRAAWLWYQNTCGVLPTGSAEALRRHPGTSILLRTGEGRRWTQFPLPGAQHTPPLLRAWAWGSNWPGIEPYRG